VKLQGTTLPLLLVFSWKRTSVKVSKMKLFLLEKITLGIRNWIMREFQYVANLVLKRDILQLFVPRGLRTIERLKNPLGG